jgi:hypothetical protein
MAGWQDSMVGEHGGRVLIIHSNNVRDVRQIEVHTDGPILPGPSHPEIKTANAKPKNYKSPDSDQIPAEKIQAGG